MAHDYKTRTIDYTEEHPPEWATPEEKVNFYPKRTAHFICEELRRAEEKPAAEQNTDKKEVAAQ